MRFLELKDFGMVLKEDILQKLIADDAEILNLAETSALDEIESFLTIRNYDTEYIFDNMSKFKYLSMITCDMVIYHIYSRHHRETPQTRGIRYDAAIKWLDDVSKGLRNPKLPKLPEEAQLGDIQNNGYISLVSEEKRKNRY